MVQMWPTAGNQWGEGRQLGKEKLKKARTEKKKKGTKERGGEKKGTVTACGWGVFEPGKKRRESRCSYSESQHKNGGKRKKK